MGIPTGRSPLLSPMLICPAAPVLVFLLLTSCATLHAPAGLAGAASTASTAVQAKRAPAPPQAAPTAPSPAASKARAASATLAASSARPKADLLAAAIPIPPAAVAEVSVLDLPAPLLPKTLSIPVIPQPQIASEARGARSESAPRLGSVRVPSPPAHGAAGAGRPVNRRPPQGARKPLPGSAGALSQSGAASPSTAAAGAPAAASVPAQGSTHGNAAGTAHASAPSSSGRGGGGQAPASAASGGSAGAATKAPRTVYAKVGDDITIALGGHGWTFTGGASGGAAWKNGVRYESRSPDSSGTTFVFKAKALGTWTLDFQQQNAAAGSSTEQRFEVRVLTPGEFTRTIAAKGGGATGASAGGGAGSANGQLAAAQWLYKEGKYAEALTAYEKAWQPDDPALTEKIAELAYRIGRYGVARKYWQKNFDLTGTQYGNLAIAGLMKSATAQKDAPELRALFDYVQSLTGVAIREDLLNAGRFLYESKDWSVAVRYLDEYLKRYKGRRGSDVADYLLGEIYAGPTPMQDAQRAMSYFRRIVADYPLSDYYERAKSNIVYLNRQFFEIR